MHGADRQTLPHRACEAQSPSSLVCPSEGPKGRDSRASVEEPQVVAGSHKGMQMEIRPPFSETRANSPKPPPALPVPTRRQSCQCKSLSCISCLMLPFSGQEMKQARYRGLQYFYSSPKMRCKRWSSPVSLEDTAEKLTN